MEEKPKIRGFHSLKLLTEPGVYYYCMCGLSQNNPFCDGSHKKTMTFSPMPVKVRMKQEVKWCDCRHSKKLPFCDNTHRGLEGYQPKTNSAEPV